MTDKEPIAYVYRGNGQHIFGVPDRSLTQAEFDDLSPQLQREVIHGSLYYPYVKPESPKDGPKRSDSKAADTGANQDGE